MCHSIKYSILVDTLPTILTVNTPHLVESRRRDLHSVGVLCLQEREPLRDLNRFYHRKNSTWTRPPAARQTTDFITKVSWFLHTRKNVDK